MRFRLLATDRLNIEPAGDNVCENNITFVKLLVGTGELGSNGLTNPVCVFIPP